VYLDQYTLHSPEHALTECEVVEVIVPVLATLQALDHIEVITLQELIPLTDVRGLLHGEGRTHTVALRSASIYALAIVF
jgi:hypothetical protein